MFRPLSSPKKFNNQTFKLVQSRLLKPNTGHKLLSQNKTKILIGDINSLAYVLKKAVQHSKFTSKKLKILMKFR